MLLCSLDEEIHLAECSKKRGSICEAEVLGRQMIVVVPEIGVTFWNNVVDVFGNVVTCGKSFRSSSNNVVLLIINSLNKI